MDELNKKKKQKEQKPKTANKQSLSAPLQLETREPGPNRADPTWPHIDEGSPGKTGR